jgi:2',3'-cyclic-nucleotide 2'-phosphodiesterase (5'-nucleotidase family)
VSTKPGQLQLPANILVTADAFDGPGITKAEFPTLAINVYNAAPLPPALQGRRVVDPYKLFTVDGMTIAVIGITASILPQQPDVFNIGLRFTQGTEDLPAILEEVAGLGAEIIVVQSELGLSQNVQLGREFEDIDVVLSAHTHELTLGALLADEDGVIATTPGQPLTEGERKRLKKGAAIVVESGEDLYLGRLDLFIDDGKIKDFAWEAVPVDDDVPEDPAMKALADSSPTPSAPPPTRWCRRRPAGMGSTSR